MSYIYELPFGRGQRFASGAAGLVEKLLGGWQIAGITTFQTGLSQSVAVLQDRCNCDSTPGTRLRADATGIRPELDHPTPDRYFNTDAFRLPPQFSFGNSGRGVLTMPGLNNFDFSVLKNFRIRESHALQFRAEFFNWFNHTQFGEPNVRVDDRNFGRIGSLLTPSRQVQFGLRYEF